MGPGWFGFFLVGVGLFGLGCGLFGGFFRGLVGRFGVGQWIGVGRYNLFHFIPPLLSEFF